MCEYFDGEGRKGRGTIPTKPRFASLLVILGREVIRDKEGGKGKNREKEEKMGIF